ncbi:hypothetical protein C1N86_18295 [Priestia aryabhattai]
MPSNQQLEASTYMKLIFTINMKKSERVRFSIKNLDSSFGSFYNENTFVPASFDYFSTDMSR